MTSQRQCAAFAALLLCAYYASSSSSFAVQPNAYRFPWSSTLSLSPIAPRPTRRTRSSSTGVVVACVVGISVCSSRSLQARRDKSKKGRLANRTSCKGVRHTQVRSAATNASRIAHEMHRIELEALQGQWQDQFGNAVDVSGDRVKWASSNSDLNKVPAIVNLQIRRTAEGWKMADLQLSTSQSKPVWTSNGGRYQWTRPETVGWEDSFLQYKHECLQLRKQLWAAVRNGDLVASNDLRNSLASARTLPQTLTITQQLRLAAGHGLTTGVCFNHRRWHVPGVIIACEPSYNPLEGLASQLPQFGNAEFATPAYHCFLDDSNGGRIALIPEDDISLSDVFLSNTSALDGLMVASPEIGGYLPRPHLEAALQQQLFQKGSRVSCTLIECKGRQSSFRGLEL